MNKIPCAFQNTEAKTLLADACIFGHFGQLSPAAVPSADCLAQSAVAIEYTDCISAEE